MTMERRLHAHGLGQNVDRCEPMWMHGRCFMRHQDVGSLIPQAAIGVPEDHRPMRARLRLVNHMALAVARFGHLQPTLIAVELRRFRRQLDLSSEDTAQARDANTGNLRDTTIEARASELRLEEVTKIEVAVSVVIAVNEANHRLAENRRELDVKWLRCLDVAEQHDGVGLLALDGGNDVAEVAVVDAKK